MPGHAMFVMPPTHPATHTTIRHDRTPHDSTRYNIELSFNTITDTDTDTNTNTSYYYQCNTIQYNTTRAIRTTHTTHTTSIHRHIDSLIHN